ncbi:hypothetical protein LCM27_01910 [Ruegeria marisrubri]|nr:hypothetical protein [Ruegeria marisrubri]
MDWQNPSPKCSECPIASL